MKHSSSVEVPVLSEVIRPFVEDLSAYPAWMPMVHQVVALSDEVCSVELRANVGEIGRAHV